MESILETLKGKQNRNSTAKVYHSIWTKFNSFLIRLDNKPPTWEERVALYCAFLVEEGIQSSTVRTYVSAIKSTLKADSYNWDDGKLMLQAITKACRIVNDTVKTRLPIQVGLMEMLLFEIERKFEPKMEKSKGSSTNQQPYLCILYKTMFILAYYGLLRIGEIAKGDHTIKAKDVKMSKNNDKLLLFLYMSKTHGKESHPQKIKIESVPQQNLAKQRLFCPLKLTQQYIRHRGIYIDDNEQFFIFSDRSPVTPQHVRNLLCELLETLGLNSTLYDCHSFRSGRTCDLYNQGYSITFIKAIGRWRSSAVYRYLK